MVSDVTDWHIVWVWPQENEIEFFGFKHLQSISNFFNHIKEGGGSYTIEKRFYKAFFGVLNPICQTQYTKPNLLNQICTLEIKTNLLNQIYKTKSTKLNLQN